MPTKAKRAKYKHSTTYLRAAGAKRHNGHHNGHPSYAQKRALQLVREGGTLYKGLVRTVRRKPYTSVGMLLGVGAISLSSIYIWSRFVR